METFLKYLQLIFPKLYNKLVTQDFKIEEYTYVKTYENDKYQLYKKGLFFKVRYLGEEWEKNRDQFMLEKHGLTFAQMQEPENAHKFVSVSVYKFS